MKKLIFASVVALLLFSGCTRNEGPQYSGSDYNQIKRYELGVVIEARPVVVSDDGGGTFLGALVGAVVGSTIGKGSGNTLATLGGGLAGAYAGNQLGKANASELTVKLDNGDQIIVLVKGKKFMAGDRIKIIRYHGRVEQVYKTH